MAGVLGMTLIDIAIESTKPKAVVIAPCSFCGHAIVSGQAMDSTTASGEDVMASLHHADASDCARSHRRATLAQLGL